MNDKDPSSDNPSFLARWSQRKHEAKQPDRSAAPAEADILSAPVAESEAGEEFDLSSLPKLEDLTETTDITAFLRKGVPESLRNAALRKSWALDPAIRNYVNPALDYAYDWNTTGGVPGSSEIGAGMDVARMVSQIMGSGESSLEPSTSATDGREPADDPAQSPEQNSADKSKLEPPTRTLRLSDEAASSGQDPSNAEAGGVAPLQTPNSDANDPAAPQQAVRRHGTAKPVV
ncbi:MAG TPA: DUF3306 domain-containing protein [Bradyrhizobium sp.]|jgi:hypothetical protein|nr:DUF3306 domain-containing protein [Bradyrhizobium sp.]